LDDPVVLFEFLPKILIQTVRVPELSGGAKIAKKIAEKFKSLHVYSATTLQTDDRQIDDRRTAYAISRT